MNDIGYMQILCHFTKGTWASVGLGVVGAPRTNPSVDTKELL